jgi:uncharacterized protein (TIGR03382 family)
LFHHLFRGLFALLLLGAPAWADSLTLTLDNDGVLYTPPGGFYQPGSCTNNDGSGFCVVFTGEITTGTDESQDYYLNELAITMNGSNPDGGAYVNDNTPTNVDYSPSLGNNYFLNATASAGGILGPDNFTATPYSYSGGIFEIDVPAYTSPGQYFGTATLDYSDVNGPDCTVGCSVSATFEVVVTPEPGPFALCAGGLALIGLLRRRFR